MLKLISLVLSLGLVGVGVFLLFYRGDAPAPKLVRAFTVHPRCLVCNREATYTLRYGMSRNAIEHGYGAQHDFCIDHPPPKELWHSIWPEVDKYISILVSIGLMLAGIGTALLSLVRPGAEAMGMVIASGGLLAIGLLVANWMEIATRG